MHLSGTLHVQHLISASGTNSFSQTTFQRNVGKTNIANVKQILMIKIKKKNRRIQGVTKMLFIGFHGYPWISLPSVESP